MKKTGGLRRKTRGLFRKHNREKGKLPLKKYLQIFNKGDIVKLTVESVVQAGMYHPMFHGKRGAIKAKRGKCYEVLINDQGKEKTLIVHPVHLKKM